MAGADPRSSIAAVGLARVALERGDDPQAWRLGRRALEIDPENVAAQRLTQRLEEVYAYRGESIAALAAAGDAGPAMMEEASEAPEPATATAPEPASSRAPASPPAPSPDTSGLVADRDLSNSGVPSTSSASDPCRPGRPCWPR